MQPFINASSLIDQPEKLRTQMKAEGYLFLPGLLQRETVATVHEAILSICQAQGWADTDGNPQGTPVVEGEEKFWAVYDPLQRLEVFHGLAHRAEILQIIEILVQDQPFVHPRNISRIVFPQSDRFTTPPHQDFIHIQGTAETYTVWFPLSDCSQAMGSLVVLAESHHQALMPVRKASGAGGLSVNAPEDDPRWRGNDFKAGDVLVFHSYTVHKALPNHTEKLRISVDYRYQGISQPIIEDGLLPHYNRLSWDEIYEGWTYPELKYYWRGLGLKTIARDPSFRQAAIVEEA